MDNCFKKNIAEDRCIYKVICGSIAYGTNVEGSDVDLRGIFIPTIDMYLTFNDFEQYEEEQNDHIIWSLNKFVMQAVKGNPTINEILFIDNKEHILLNTKFIEIIKKNRNNFLGKHMHDAFVGYAQSQIHRMEVHRKWLTGKIVEPKQENYVSQKAMFDKNGKNWFVDKFDENSYKADLKKWHQFIEWRKNRNPKRSQLEEKHGYDCKHAMHCFRLMNQLKDIYMLNTIRVYNEEMIPTYLKIRNGDYTYDEFMHMYKTILSQVESMKTTSNLPDEIDNEFIQSLKLDVIKTYLREKDNFIV